MSDRTTILLIPEPPDVCAQQEVSTATLEFERSQNICCQVEIHVEEGSYSWKLYSRDQRGHRKQTGGDEFYIRYEEYRESNYEEKEEELQKPALQAVAIITDHDDGSYSLDFATTPMYPNLPATDESIGKRLLSVHFEYSNGIGSLPPPTKHKWQNGGYTHKLHIYPFCPQRPRIRTFCAPSCRTGDIDLGNFDKVLAFGDSTMDQFVRQRPNKKGKYYFQPNIRVGEKVRVGLNHETLETLLELLHTDFGDELSNQDSRIALIVGSCLWDILNSQDTLQGKGYENHIQACRDYIRLIRERYPNATVFWKSPMAVHIHWVDLARLVEHDKKTASLFGVDRVRYMSASRSRYLHERQVRLMKEELDVPVLDLYEATYLSADQLYPSDGRHYRPDLNRLMLSWFYPPHEDSQIRPP